MHRSRAQLLQHEKPEEALPVERLPVVDAGEVVGGFC